MALTEKISLLRHDMKDHGIAKAFSKASLNAFNRIVPLRALKCLTIETVNPDFLETDSRYTCTFLDRERILEFAKDSTYDLSSVFLEEALAKGDECYAILDGNVLASYGWYASTPTNLNRSLRLTFSQRYIYMHRGYTHARYRGQRLHAIGMTRALQAYLNRGYKGLISYVDADNFASLKSCYRMGYREFGCVYAIKVFQGYQWWASPGCREYAFGLEQIS